MEGGWLPEVDKDEGVADCDIPDDDPMETNLIAEGDDELLNDPRETVYYTLQVSPTEYEAQGKDYTKDEVEELMRSDGYQRKISTCHLCGQCWYDGKCSQDCPECGGFPMSRPCPICGGQCSQVWQRSIKGSHSYHEAHWDGTCLLPPEVQHAYMVQKLTSSSEEKLTEGMQDLSTR